LQGEGGEAAEPRSEAKRKKRIKPISYLVFETKRPPKLALRWSIRLGSELLKTETVDRVTKNF